WIAPSEKAVEMGLSAIQPGAMDWIGMLLVCIVLPAVLTWLISLPLRKIGWIREGDLKLD
ncbi:MAG: PTS sugar transporter subunit IIC, partial [Oscillospiraceae bacterium]|nr:PTS sugar transporter subunit IIC [Oscillospiraceae bacterium]